LRNVIALAVARDAAEKQKALPKQGFLVFGGESGTRTPDLRIMIPRKTKLPCVDSIPVLTLDVDK